tara:strand:+ start:80 stop:343 length:264 start_codon:yes stop_codon:yes gene_type:complete
MDPLDIVNKGILTDIILDDSLNHLRIMEKNINKYKSEDTEKMREVILDIKKLGKKIADLKYKSHQICDFDKQYSRMLLKQNQIDLWK